MYIILQLVLTRKDEEGERLLEVRAVVLLGEDNEEFARPTTGDEEASVAAIVFYFVNV